MHQYKKILLLFILLSGFFIRFFVFNQSPPSLYWEEVALGYDAYSIKETLRDHHGNFLPIVAFESFGDWKPSAYFYSIVPFLYIFDLSPIAVRMPSLLAGSMIVLGMYYFTKFFLLFFQKKLSTKKIEQISIVAAMFTAVNPWTIMFSRAAWEVNLATAFLLWAIIFSLKWLNKKRVLNLCLAGVLFALSTYTYHSTRIIAPLIFAAILLHSFMPILISLFKGKISSFKQLIKPEIFAGLIFLIIFIPIIVSSTKPSVSQRFTETSIFYNLDIIIESNRSKELSTSIFSNLFFHRYVLFSREILINASSNFSLDFLFVHGDSNVRHSTGFNGLFYYQDLAALLIGLYFLIRHKNRGGFFLLFWLIVGIFPASISKTNPHALRILPTAPIFIFVASYGIVNAYFKVASFAKKINISQIKATFSIFLVAIYLTTFVGFFLHLIRIYPIEHSKEWQYGYQELMKKVGSVSSDTSLPIYVTRAYGRPSMYYFFFNKISPNLVQQRNSLESKDQSEFTSFNNIRFIDSVGNIAENSFIFLTPSEAMIYFDEQNNLKSQELIYESYDLSGKKIWEGYEITF